MNTTTAHDAPQRPHRTTFRVATGLVLALALGMTALALLEPMTMAIAFVIAGVGAAGTMAMAWLMQRGSVYPRWAWWATGAVMATALLASVPISGDAVRWDDHVLPGAWMLPVYLMVMGSGRPREQAACAPASARTGWLMVGTGTLLSVVLLGAHAIVDALARLWAR